MEYLNLIIAFLVGVVYPAFAIITGSKTRRLIENSEVTLQTVFRSSATMLIISALLIFISLYLNSIKLNSVGFSFIYDPLALVALVLCCGLGLWIFNKRKIKSDDIEKLKNSYKDIIYLFPVTKADYKASLFTSVAAGFCEEIIFRGFLFWISLQYMPLIAAIILVNIIFALGHSETKLKNALSAFILGIVLSISYLITDSLWLAVCIHILVDFSVMTVGYKYNHHLNTSRAELD